MTSPILIYFDEDASEMSAVIRFLLGWTLWVPKDSRVEVVRELAATT